MKNQPLFSSKNKSKKLKCRLLQFLFGALRVNWNVYVRASVEELNCFTTKKQMTKFSSANFQKNAKSKLYHIENSKTRGQTV